MDVVTIDLLCRCCLNENRRSTSLYDKYTDDELVLDPEITYSDAIFMCTNVRFDEIESSNGNDNQTVEWPKTICDVCLNELRVAINFRLKCEDSDRLLRQQRHQIAESNQLLYENFCVEEIVENEQIDDGAVVTIVGGAVEADDTTSGFVCVNCSMVRLYPQIKFEIHHIRRSIEPTAMHRARRNLLFRTHCQQFHLSHQMHPKLNHFHLWLPLH